MSLYAFVFLRAISRVKVTFAVFVKRAIHLSSHLQFRFYSA